MGPVPDSFRVLFKTSQGDFTVEACKEWSPRGAERFYELVKSRFYDNTRIFRVKPGFVVQFGISGDPKISKIWKDKAIQDDPVRKSNTRGTMAYAMDVTPHSRTTQIYINYSDNSRLDIRGFAPFATVVEGMEVTEKFYDGYGKTFDEQEEQDKIEERGNGHLDEYFPLLDKIYSAEILS